MLVLESTAKLGVAVPFQLSPDANLLRHILGQKSGVVFRVVYNGAPARHQDRGL